MAYGDTSPQEDPDRIESADGGLWASILRILQLLWRPQMARWRFRMVLAILITVGAKGFEVVAPVLLGNAINALTGDGDLAAAWPLAVTGLGLFALSRFASAGLPQARDALFTPVTQDAQRIVAVDAFRHAQHLSLNFHQTRRTGALNRIIERGGNAIEYLIRFLAFNIGPTLIGLVLAATVLAVTYDWTLAVVAVFTVVIYVIFTVIVTEWRVKQRRVMNTADTHWRAVSVDAMSNFETVKSFAAEDRESDRFDAAIQHYNSKYIPVVRSMNLLNAGQELIMNLGLFAMLAVAAWHVVDSGRLEIGDVTAAMLLLFNLYRPLNILGWAWREIKQGAVDLEKLYGLLGMLPEVADNTGARDLHSAKGDVSFHDVAFSHEGRSIGVNDINFDVPAGKKIAFVGTSGAGKSTLLKLLFRFYDVEAGRVCVDGTDVRDLTQSSLRRQLGLVPQDVVLFNDTIRANLIYGRPDATESEIHDALRRAQLSEFVSRLPDGLDTRVGERGLKLSGGEKQRVGIARVILADPAVLVLDEATSALDSATEAAVQDALEEASRGRTTLMVAHRLSTVQGADEILVLDAGRIVERGTHDTLIAASGTYADMWARQASRDTLVTAAE